MNIPLTLFVVFAIGFVMQIGDVFSHSNRARAESPIIDSGELLNILARRGWKLRSAQKLFRLLDALHLI